MYIASPDQSLGYHSYVKCLKFRIHPSSPVYVHFWEGSVKPRRRNSQGCLDESGPLSSPAVTQQTQSSPFSLIIENFVRFLSFLGIFALKPRSLFPGRMRWRCGRDQPVAGSSWGCGRPCPRLGTAAGDKAARGRDAFPEGPSGSSGVLWNAAPRPVSAALPRGMQERRGGAQRALLLRAHAHRRGKRGRARGLSPPPRGPPRGRDSPARRCGDAAEPVPPAPGAGGRGRRRRGGGSGGAGRSGARMRAPALRDGGAPAAPGPGSRSHRLLPPAGARPRRGSSYRARGGARCPGRAPLSRLPARRSPPSARALPAPRASSPPAPLRRRRVPASVCSRRSPPASPAAPPPGTRGSGSAGSAGGAGTPVRGCGG